MLTWSTERRADVSKYLQGSTQKWKWVLLLYEEPW
jgi:hypothetical protein